MKKIFLLLSFIFCVPFFGQNSKMDIEKQFLEYHHLIVEKKFEEALDRFGNDDYLKMFPKEQLIAGMNKMFNDPEITLKLNDPSNISVSDEVTEKKENKFIKLNFQQKMEMKFNEADLNTDTILSVLKTSFGGDNVIYDESTGFFLIETSKTAVASSSNLKDWKFTLLEKKQIPMLKAFIPEQYLKEIK